MPPLVRSRFDTPPTKALPKITIKSLLSSFYLSFNPYKPYANADKQYFRLNINITVVTVYCINGYPKLPTMILPILTGVNRYANPSDMKPNLRRMYVAIFAENSNLFFTPIPKYIFYNVLNVPYSN